MGIYALNANPLALSHLSTWRLRWDTYGSKCATSMNVDRPMSVLPPSKGVSLGTFDVTGRDPQLFVLGLAGLAWSKPNRLSLNRFGHLKPEPSRAEPVHKPVSCCFAFAYGKRQDHGGLEPRRESKRKRERDANGHASQRWEKRNGTPFYYYKIGYKRLLQPTSR